MMTMCIYPTLLVVNKGTTFFTNEVKRSEDLPLIRTGTFKGLGLLVGKGATLLR